MSKDFVYFEQIKDYLSKNVVYRFNNSGKPTICLFGNCHVAVIGDYLNEILSEAFDVVVILSWVFEKENIPVSPEICEEISRAVNQSDYFFYMKHVRSMGVNAHEIEKYCRPNAKVFILPNIQVNYLDDKELVRFSIEKCAKSLKNSSFANFGFLPENIDKIRFVDLPDHPTNYVLYLLSLQASYLVKGKCVSITIEDYYKKKMDDTYVNFSPIELPGFESDSIELNKILGYNCSREHYSHKQIKKL